MENSIEKFVIPFIVMSLRDKELLMSNIEMLLNSKGITRMTHGVAIRYAELLRAQGIAATRRQRTEHKGAIFYWHLTEKGLLLAAELELNGYTTEPIYEYPVTTSKSSKSKKTKAQKIAESARSSNGSWKDHYLKQIERIPISASDYHAMCRVIDDNKNTTRHELRVIAKYINAHFPHSSIFIGENTSSIKRYIELNIHRFKVSYEKSHIIRKVKIVNA